MRTSHVPPSNHFIGGVSHTSHKYIVLVIITNFFLFLMDFITWNKAVNSNSFFYGTFFTLKKRSKTFTNLSNMFKERP